jgi:hypothetical protein
VRARVCVRQSVCVCVCVCVVRGDRVSERVREKVQVVRARIAGGGRG